MKLLNKKIYFLLLFVISTIFTSNLFSAVTFTEGPTAAQLANQIQGAGLTITNPVITHGNARQLGIFSNGTDEGLAIDEGITFSGMTVTESFTTNSSGSTSQNPGSNHNDPDLLAIDAGAFRDVVVFEFDVTLDDNTRLLLIDYQFASEEYNEYVGSRFNDAFGFFISGGDLNQTYNIARVVDNQTFVTIDNIGNYLPVTVNNVNNGTVGVWDDGTPENLTNAAYFIDNTGGGIDVEYDGLTVSLHAALDNLTPGVTYHFKMALADTGDAQWDTGVFVNKINGLREPEICYDYAYKQNEQYINNDYNASTGPVLTASNLISNNPSYPIEVSMYIKNIQESEIVASNVKFDVYDLNTSQATYKTESVSVIETGELYRTKIDDVDLNVSDSYVKDIPISSFNALDYFYTYFSIDPLMSDLNLPIKARITYDLTLPISATESITLNRSSEIDQDISICSSNYVYKPTPGIFSIVHNDYYELDTNPLSSKKYYNIPTQVTSREGNFKVISLDVNNTDQLVGRSTIVAVEMVDISAFHDTDASCNEQSNAISERVWVIFDNNATSTQFNQAALQSAIANYTTDITNSADFYTQARSNAAFRLSYNTPNGEDDLLKVTAGKKAGTYDINFPDLTTLYGTNCAGGRSVIYDHAKNKTTNMIPVACKSNSDITPENLQSCMECIYGYSTQFVCSRDNFSIRPEAFLMHIDDQNQTSPTSQNRLSTDPNFTPALGDYSGITGAVAFEMNVAADYNYQLEVNATNHLNNVSSVGYIKSFDPNFNTSDLAQYIWEPRDITLANANLNCNEPVDQNLSITFFNGVSDSNTSLIQVGEYRLNILDTTWTTVDSNESYMTHHTGSYFLPLTTPDCTQNETRTYPVNTSIDLNNFGTTLIGCNISSDHTGSTSNLVYNDYEIEFHPYQLNIANTMSLSTTNILPVTPANAPGPFIYMANIGNDENMSVHFNTTILPRGYNSASPLSNYVGGCYAKPLNVDIEKADINNTITPIYKYAFHNYNLAGDINTTHDINGTISANDFNASDINISTLGTFFHKEKNGVLTTLTNLNFNREVNTTYNPVDINFTTYSVEDNATTFSADLITNKTVEGNSTINQNVLHYYGRTAAKDTTVICTTGVSSCVSGTDDDDVYVKYEIFCNGAECYKDLLPVDAGGFPTQSIDGRWYTSLNHTTASYEGITSMTNTYVTASPIVYDNNSTIKTPHSYNMGATPSLPYTAVMQDNVPNWFIYNELNPGATFNTHTVIYRPQVNWSGEHEADSKTETKIIQRVNRRTMW